MWSFSQVLKHLTHNLVFEYSASKIIELTVAVLVTSAINSIAMQLAEANKPS